MASFTYSPSSPSPGDPITFDASGSSDPDGDLFTYEWDWTNYGTYDIATSDPDQDATHTYATAATYTVKLRVSDGNGGVDTEELAEEEKHTEKVEKLIEHPEVVGELPVL